MLSLLLDENLSPELVKQLAEKRPDISVISVHHWHEGRFKAQRDEAILVTAATEGLTLVTYDQKTIVPVLTRWGRADTDHAGVIFVDDRTIASNNFGALVRALTALWGAGHEDAWTNGVAFLRVQAD